MTDAAAPNFAEPSHYGPSHGYQPRQMVLLGAGHAHVHVLKALAANPPGVRITLVTPHPLQMYSGMVPGYVAGHYGLDDCVIPLEPLVRRGGIRWLQRSVKALDTAAQTVTLDDGSTLHYDWLSINTGPVQSRAQLERSMPGAREHGLFARPMEAFAALWPKVVEMGATRALRVAVIGAGAGGIELAFAPPP
jgi:NADH dehydrogenase FAD-containing subunit